MPTYSVGAASSQTESKLPKFVVALNVVSLVVMLLHVPAGIVYSRMLREYAIVMGLAPVATLFAFAAVYLPSFGCAVSTDEVAKRIRVLSTLAAILDFFAAILVPVVFNSERQKVLKKDAAKASQLKRIPLEKGMGLFLAVVIFVHLVLCVVVRMHATLLADRNNPDVDRVQSHTAPTGEFTCATPPPL